MILYSPIMTLSQQHNFVFFSSIEMLFIFDGLSIYITQIKEQHCSGSVFLRSFLCSIFLSSFSINQSRIAIMRRIDKWHVTILLHGRGG